MKKKHYPTLIAGLVWQAVTTYLYSGQGDKHTEPLNVSCSEISEVQHLQIRFLHPSHPEIISLPVLASMVGKLRGQLLRNGILVQFYRS